VTARRTPGKLSPLNVRKGTERIRNVEGRRGSQFEKGELNHLVGERGMLPGEGLQTVSSWVLPRERPQ